MGAFLVPVSRVQVHGASFDSDGKTIIHFPYISEAAGLIVSLRKLEDMFVEHDAGDHQFVYHSAAEGIHTLEEVKRETEAAIRNCSPSEASLVTLLNDLWAEVHLLQNWMKDIGSDNEFYLLIA